MQILKILFFIIDKIISLTVILFSLYFCMFIFSAILYHAPWIIIENIHSVKRDHLISLGVFSRKTHPLYRAWLYHFVSPPNTYRSAQHVMDTYRIYNVIISENTDERDQMNDALGFPNSISPHDARVLFVGDSFGAGASAGSQRAPALAFQRLTNIPVYNASNGGYGLAQYIAIVKYFTQTLPAPQRFTGKDVVLLTFLGNDYLSDLIQHEIEDVHLNHTLLWIAQLGPIMNWIQYIKSGGALTEPQKGSAAELQAQQSGTKNSIQIPEGRYSPIQMKCYTKDCLPFALPPSYSAFLHRDLIMSYAAKSQPFIDELKTFKEKGCNIKIVIIPICLQVLYDDIDWNALPSSSSMNEELPILYSCMNDVSSAIEKIYRDQGFETLNLAPELRDSPQRCQYYQPADTHCTAIGYDAIAHAIAKKWPNIGN